MKPKMMSVVSAFLFFQLLAMATIHISFCNGSSYVGCNETERKALLSFKHDLKDPSNRLASWIGDGDCCNWDGVVCNNFTGYVIKLKLPNPRSEYFTSDYYSFDVRAEYEAYNRSKLVGKINSSLIDLKHLIHLDLSFNDFQGIQIPPFLGSMHNLRYLNLSHAGFHGMIPQQLGNLSNLQYLDLHHSFVFYHEGLFVENLNWISGLTSLKHLDLSGANLNKTSDHWLIKISSLPLLEVLQLSYCQLQHFDQVANFSSLTTLDLSRNAFVSLIPSWVFSLPRIVFLDLSHNYFEGPIVDGFGNLTSLRHLDLSFNSFNSSSSSCVFGLSGLVYLDLKFNQFEGSIVDGFGNLTSLRHLDLSYNSFNSSIPDWLSRFSCLEYLSLSRSNLQGSISSALGNLTTSIKTLDLSYNPKLEGIIPTSFGRFCNLRSISLSTVNLNSNLSQVLDVFSGCVSARLESLMLGNCQLSGHLSDQLGRFKILGRLDLRNNSICGPVPLVLGELSYLRILDLSNNKLNGTLSQIHFKNLTRLVEFSASDNSQISVKVNSDWTPPFQLESLNLRSCHLGPQFPLWLHSQKSLSELDISYNEISDIIPDWFWRSISQFSWLTISHNQIHQKIPNLSDAGLFNVLDLSSNKFFGQLPRISFDVYWILDLSNNAFSGSISQFLCYPVDVSKRTEILNLENNSLSGELPDCWMNWPDLTVLNLGNNEFTGSLPTSIGSLDSLQSLILRKNNLSGVIPALKNCTELVVLDVSKNHFGGNVLTWIGERLARIKILKLRSNNFHGLLPAELCRLSYLQILDLAYNNLFGNIPICINNFSAMATTYHLGFNDIQYLSGGSSLGEVNFGEHALLVRKGREYEYSTILNLVRAIDLSKNNFSGEIPSEVTSLRALWWLNLSHNSFNGRIPENIGAMNEIDSIDFSENQLSGEIPQSISNLTFLSQLNLSNNKLTGRIPLGTQIQSFDASSFTGNDLCGSPLPKNCSETVEAVPLGNKKGGEKDGNEHEVDWFYVSLALGFMVGFWGLISPLLISRRWRHMYGCFLDDLGDKISFAVRKYF